MNNVPDSPERERILWLSVIRQAQFDAEGRGEIDPEMRGLAKWWLTNLTQSFLDVCSLAGMPATQAHYLQEQDRGKYAAVAVPVTQTIYFEAFKALIDTKDVEDQKDIQEEQRKWKR